MDQRFQGQGQGHQDDSSPDDTGGLLWWAESTAVDDTGAETTVRIGDGPPRPPRLPPPLPPPPERSARSSFLERPRATALPRLPEPPFRYAPDGRGALDRPLAEQRSWFDAEPDFTAQPEPEPEPVDEPAADAETPPPVAAPWVVASPVIEPRRPWLGPPAEPAHSEPSPEVSAAEEMAQHDAPAPAEDRSAPAEDRSAPAEDVDWHAVMREEQPAPPAGLREPVAEPHRLPALPQRPAAPPPQRAPSRSARTGRPDASAISSAALLRSWGPTPEQGWRRYVYLLSKGYVNPGPSRREIERAELIKRLNVAIDGSRSIAVISRKGGVGKTTTTLMLGHAFALWRGDRVVALDGNPDAGSLGYRVHRDTGATMTDLLRDAQMIDRYAGVRAYTSQAPSRLEVVASDDDALITQALGEDEYSRAIKLMERFYNLILLDTGTGILDSATQGILRMVDQIVVVAAPSVDGARAASLTLDWLERNGYDHLVDGAVAVLNQARGRGLVNLERLEEHFSQRCRATVALPWDAHLEAGAESDPKLLATRTRDSYLRLAAAVAEGFGEATGRAGR